MRRDYNAKDRIADTRERLASFARAQGPAALAAKEYLQWFVFSKERPAGVPAQAKKPPPTVDEMLARGEARSACAQFRDGAGGISIAMGDGRTMIVTAHLMPGEDAFAIRRGDRLRLVKLRAVEGKKSLVVSRSMP